MHPAQVKTTKLFQSFFLFCLIAAACTATSFGNDAGGPLLRLSFSGTSNDPAWVFKLDTSAGYRFNRHFEISGGVPIYFVRASDSGATDGFTSKNGIGDAYINLRLMISRPDYYFSSSIKGAAPTGDDADGFSTGRVTFDWTNYFEGDIGKWTPFGSAGIANTISDTHFFNRPFTSLGTVGHFEGGLYFWPSEKIGIAGSAYAVTPTGQQKIYSKLMQRQSPITPPSTTGNAGRGNRLERGGRCTGSWSFGLD
jgi:hypothetical protein